MHFTDEYENAAVLQGDSTKDFGEMPECAQCHKEDPKCLLCGNCHAIFYCSPECVKAGWRDRIIEENGALLPGHKIMCQQNKEQMSRVSDLQAILKQFHWARTESDGTFRSRIFLASKDLLGTGNEFGFWLEEPCCKEHGLDLFEWGLPLLQPVYPEEKAGWKLPDNEIPWLTFDNVHRPPQTPSKFENSWKDYYQWRSLPLTSPAALLLHWPLSVYQLLNKLKVISPEVEQIGESHKLLVHYIGVEEELGYLPVFGELALLLPHTDLELVFFGEPAYMILHSARHLVKSPTIISNAVDDKLYTYTAPKECGAGTVRIVLWGGGPTWTPEVLRFGAPVPDAIIGLNAGLNSYPAWQSAIVSSRAFSIPFGITDFTEASFELNKGLITGLTVDLPKEADDWVKEIYGEEGVINMRRAHEMPSELNPFMRPGQKTGAAWSRLPAAVNGFTFIVTSNLGHLRHNTAVDEGGFLLAK